MDNFDRHVWMMVGAAIGVLMTALFGWPVALGWLIGQSICWGVVFGIVTDRIVLRRKTGANTSS